jgi:hypothetical protein
MSWHTAAADLTGKLLFYSRLRWDYSFPLWTLSSPVNEIPGSLIERENPFTETSDYYVLFQTGDKF